MLLKPFPVMIMPIYLLNLREKVGILKAILYVLSVPLLICLVFFIWSPVGFTKSIIFSFMRPGGGIDKFQLGQIPLVDFVGGYGILPRIPIILLFISLYYLVYTNRVRGMPAPTLMAFMIFLAYNPYIYPRYFSWMIPFIPLTLVEIANKRR